MRSEKSAREIADIIERFLSGASLYLQEWNDFVECRQSNPKLETYRNRCYALDPLVNGPALQDPDAIAELRGIIVDLRILENPT
jgi:hypothetical protein